MHRLLLFLSPARHPLPGAWDTRDAVLDASAGAVRALNTFGPQIASWPAWVMTVLPPEGAGFWVWEGQLTVLGDRVFEADLEIAPAYTWRPATHLELLILTMCGSPLAAPAPVPAIDAPPATERPAPEPAVSAALSMDNVLPFARTR